MKKNSLQDLWKNSERIVIILLAVFLLTNAGQAANRVMIKAIAAEDYIKARALNANMKVQTYQFIEGQQFKGITKDEGMERITFNDIVMDLAQHLVKQNFYPNPDPGKGDLLISVHYGVTDFEEDQMDLLGYTSLEELGYTEGIESIGRSGTSLSPGEMDAINNLHSNLAMQSAINSSNDMTRYQKAQLLGIDELYTKRLHPQDKYEYEHMLQQERYFIVLMAYDYAHFRQTGKAKLLWSTRYSVRSPGQSFETAFTGMNRVASDYFGKNFDKLTRKRLDDKSSVEIGDIEVITDDPDSN